MLSLEMFGYYTLASMVAMSLGRLSGPVFLSIYPRLTQLVSLGYQDGLKQLYNKSCQLISVLILPIAIVVSFFSYEILLLWTKSPTMAEKTHLLVSILICGSAIEIVNYDVDIFSYGFSFNFGDHCNCHTRNNGSSSDSARIKIRTMNSFQEIFIYSGGFGIE